MRSLLLSTIRGKPRSDSIDKFATDRSYSSNDSIFRLEIITGMKNSRVSYQNKLPPKQYQPPPQSRIASLKAIMNQGRVPLSQYINARPKKHHPTQPPQSQSYFDKLKAMMTNQSAENFCQIELKHNSEEGGLDKMEVEDNNDHLNQYLCQFEATSPISPLKNRVQTSCMRNKERSKSIQTNHRKLTTIGQMPAQTPNLYGRCLPSPKAPIPERSLTHTETSKNTADGGYYLKGGKQVKKEVVDYRKYTVIVGGNEQVRVVQLQEVLGCGANATVRVGRERQSSCNFAIKIYEKYKLVETKKKKRVMQQIQILSKLDHPNIIQLTHCFEDKRQIHLLFEHIPQAQNLQEYIRLHSYNLPPHQKKEIAIKIAQALQYLHSLGISHRDLKTDNIILGSRGEVKLIDFGFATTVAKADIHCGTPNYMAPELFEKKNVYDPLKVDVWAFGVLLYYLHQCCYPFKGYNEKDLSRNIFIGKFNFAKSEEKVRKAIEGALAVNPSARLTMSELIEMLRH